jgi:molybdopterin-guanine dinucleotide biosynthesis protein A
MGRAKAWLPWRGRPMVAHVVALLRSVVDEVVVVTSDELELPALDARIVRDREPALGPLAGVREGLSNVEAPLAFVTGTDAPFLTPEFVETLLSFGSAAAVEVDGFVQTLSAVYPRSAAKRAGALLAAGRRRPLDLLEVLHYRVVAPDELPDVDAFRGFNTPGEYLEAVRAAGIGAGATVEFLGHSHCVTGTREREVEFGTLAQVLTRAAPELDLVAGERVARPFLVSLDGRQFVRDTSIPIGPGEHVIVMDASVGG